MKTLRLMRFHELEFLKLCLSLCLVIIVQEDTPTGILKFRRKLVPYYPYKDFMILGKYYQALKNAPTRVKQCTHAVDMHVNDYVMNFNKEIPYVANTSKTISVLLYLISSLLHINMIKIIF